MMLMARSEVYSIAALLYMFNYFKQRFPTDL